MTDDRNETFNDPEIRELYERAKAGDKEARQQLEEMDDAGFKLLPETSPYFQDSKRTTDRDVEVDRALELLRRLDEEGGRR